MLCGPDEVGLGEDTGGIMELDPSLKPGSLVSDAFSIGSDEVCSRWLFRKRFERDSERDS